ncbi:LysR family transcriptional regulator [Variovorax guangxiensis]|uniref:LysR family transcriptional regulator n=1 Tax=Variovorax guangxiensis TaxID=1775474 RepID=A0A502DZC6_9BURK|nr:LysR family transcriptional regulator [Variovorax guangxiensis]RZI66238.1 MAG: LysR family transcriptional regulator [Variovorax sp.]TPG26749.1 LysR family transcriptional regulator [Variovorax ginsengisoli]TPG30474.1 LysR family transcriptional regulator [Variovorax guangxiensis]
MDQIQAMRVFSRVVETGSFTRAADSLALPKGTVTKQIQALEARVRVKLLNRTTRRVTVTPDGAAYYERASRLLTDLDDLDASMTNAQANPSGRLRIDVGSSVATLLLIPAIEGFQERYPDIQLDMGVSDRIVDLIADNVDCVIRVGEITDQSLVARRIGHLPFVNVAAPAYIRRHGTPMHPHDLEKSHRVVNHFSGNTRRMYPLEFNKDGEHIEPNAPYRLAVNESNSHTVAVLAGLGASQMVTFVAQPYLDAGELVQILPDWTREPLPIYVVYPPNRHLSAKVRAFVDWTAELFSQHPQLQRS